MQKITKYVTFDGKEHLTEKAAVLHLNRELENRIGKHADKLHGLKRLQIWEYLMTNIKDLAACSEILADYSVNDDTED